MLKLKLSTNTLAQYINFCKSFGWFTNVTAVVFFLLYPFKKVTQVHVINSINYTKLLAIRGNLNIDE